MGRGIRGAFSAVGFAIAAAALAGSALSQAPADPPWGAAQIEFRDACLSSGEFRFVCPPLRSLLVSAAGEPGSDNRDFVIEVPQPGILSLAVDGMCSGKQQFYQPDICWTRSEVGEPSKARGNWEDPAHYRISINLERALGGALNVPRYDNDGITQNGWKTERLIIAQLKHTVRQGTPEWIDLSPALALRYEDDQLYFTTELEWPATEPPLLNGECPAGQLRGYRHDAFEPGNTAYYQARALLAHEGNDFPLEFRNNPSNPLNLIVCIDTLQLSGPRKFAMPPRDKFFDLAVFSRGHSETEAGQLIPTVIAFDLYAPNREVRWSE